MLQLPKPLGLILCDYVLIERGTDKPTLVGIFSGIACNQFPSTPRPFEVFAALTDGLGEGEFSLAVVHLEKEQVVSEHRVKMDFPDPFTVVNFRFRFTGLTFPEPGTYLFELSGEGEPICHRRVSVYLKEMST